MIDVLEALEDPGIEAHTSVVLAYNVDLLVYDKLLRRRLASAGATSQVVFCDATAYAGALDAVDATSKIGLAYSVTPVRAVGAFHPKAYLLLGARRGRLIIGSGNASLGGLVRNAEVFGSFEFDEERDAAPHAAFAAIFGLCRRLAGAEFQDSCRLAIQACLALDFEDPLSYSGLRQTTRTGCQLRVFPDQRSGWRWRAAS